MPDLTPRTTAPEDPDGFGLACRHCGHLWPQDVVMGVLGAHMEVEHGAGPDDQIELELAVLCPRCHQAMQPTGRQETTALGVVKSWWGCTPCHRTRVVQQRRDKS